MRYYSIPKPKYDDNHYGAFGGGDYWRDLKEWENNKYYYEQSEKKKEEQKQKELDNQSAPINYVKEPPIKINYPYTKTTFVAKWIDNDNRMCCRKVVAFSDNIKAELELFVRELKSTIPYSISIEVIEETIH